MTAFQVYTRTSLSWTKPRSTWPGLSFDFSLVNPAQHLLLTATFRADRRLRRKAQRKTSKTQFWPCILFWKGNTYHALQCHINCFNFIYTSTHISASGWQHIPAHVERLEAGCLLCSRRLCSALMASNTWLFAGQSHSGFILKLGNASWPPRFTLTHGSSMALLMASWLQRRFLRPRCSWSPSSSPATTVRRSTISNAPCFRNTSNATIIDAWFCDGLRRGFTICHVTNSNFYNNSCKHQGGRPFNGSSRHISNIRSASRGYCHGCRLAPAKEKHTFALLHE